MDHRRVGSVAALSVVLLFGCPTQTKIVNVYIDGGQSVPGVYGSSISGRGGSRQVPQGAGTVTVVISGVGLSGVSNATSDLQASVQGASTDSSVSVAITVPHGATLGEHDITVTCPAGTFTMTGAYTVTPITASPTAGSDSNAGTPDSPFQTVTHALAQSGADDTVHLAAGVFTNEPWTAEYDVPFPPLSVPNVPAGVTIEGEDAGSTVIAVGITDGGTFVAFSLNGNNTLRALSITGFDRNAVLWQNDLTLDNVELAGAKVDGVIGFGDGGISLTGNTRLHDNGQSAIAAFDNVSIYGFGATIDHNPVTGAYVNGASASFFNTAFTSNGGLSPSYRNAAIYENIYSTVNLVNCQLDQNAGYGIDVVAGGLMLNGTSITNTLDHVADGGDPHSGIALALYDWSSGTMLESTVSGTTGNGIQINQTSQLNVDYSTISNTQYSGLVSADQSQLTISNSLVENIGVAAPIGDGLYLYGRQTAVSNTTIRNIHGTGIQIWNQEQFTARHIVVSNTLFDGLNVNAQGFGIATASIDDAWFDGNESGMSVYEGSLNASSVVVSDAGIDGLYLQGLSSATLSPGTTDGGISAGTTGQFTVPSPSGVCIFDARPAGTSIIQVQGPLWCLGSGALPNFIAPGLDITGPVSIPTSSAPLVGYLDMVNATTIDFE